MKALKSSILITITILVLGPITTSAQTIYVEGEDFTDSHDIAYEVIRSMSGPSCSGGYWLVGLDYPTEWVEYTVPVSSFGYYMPSMRLEGDLGSLFRMRMTVYPPTLGDPQTVTFDFSGNGFS